MICVNGEPLNQRGMTVDDVLKSRNDTCKLLEVRIDGTLVPRTAYPATEVPDGADVQVIHMIAGG